MVTAYERKSIRFVTDESGSHSVDCIEAYGLSTDTKPTQYVANGSAFVEMDTGKLYFYDEESGEWLDFAGGDG